MHATHAQPAALQRDTLVEILAGQHAGLCGWIREIVVEHTPANPSRGEPANSTVWCIIEIQGQREFVRAKRCEVPSLDGGRP